jgi:hypothetical protein
MKSGRFSKAYPIEITVRQGNHAVVADEAFNAIRRKTEQVEGRGTFDIL